MTHTEDWLAEGREGIKVSPNEELQALRITLQMPFAKIQACKNRDEAVALIESQAKVLLSQLPRFVQHTFKLEE